MIEVSWPSVLIPRIITPFLSNQTRSASESLSGFKQKSSSIAQFWNLTLEFNTLKRHQILPFRAFVAAMEGSLNYTRVPIWDERMITQHQLDQLDVPHSDTTLFSDDSGYGQAAADTSVAVTLGTKSITIPTTDIPGRMLAGAYFGLGDGVHICTAVDYTDPNNVVIDFQPAVRATGTVTMTMRPTLRAQFSGDGIGAMPLELGLRGKPTLDFTEYFS